MHIPIDIALAALIGAAFGGAQFLLQRKQPLASDEGYVWYGSLRVLEGQTPLRDFRAYEPGRYYLFGTLMRLFGTGVHGFRLAYYPVNALALALLALSFRWTGLGWMQALLCTLVLAFFIKPTRPMMVEPLLVMVSVFAGAVWLHEPSLALAGVNGAIAGFIFFFGINYGLYCAAAQVLLLLLAIHAEPDLPLVGTAGMFAAGVIAGLFPFALLIALRPGLWAAFFERRVRTIVERGTSNLPLPIPWPWRPLPTTWIGIATPAGARLMQMVLFAAPVLCILVLAFHVQGTGGDLQRDALSICAAAHLLFVQHHAWSRADFSHFGPVAQLLALLSFAMSPATWIAGLLLLAFWIAVWICCYRRYDWPQRSHQLISSSEFTDELYFSSSELELLRALRGLQVDNCERRLFAAPVFPHFFPLLRIKSPVYDTYCVYPQTELHQEQMIREIKTRGVKFAVIWDGLLDDREALRFRNTHPLVFTHLLHHFVECKNPLGTNSNYLLFELKQ